MIKNNKIIEIGAGTGNITCMLYSQGYEKISVGEIHFNGLEYSKRYGITELYQFDLLNPPFKDNFDVAGVFDVIEHLTDDNLAIKNIYNILNQKGKVL